MKPFKSITMLAATVCLGVLTLASGPGRRAMEGGIQGYVVDAVTRKPLAGVTIQLQGKSVSEQSCQAENTGYFRFSKLPLGEVYLVVEKKGYKVFKSEMQMIKEGTTKLNIEVQPVGEGDELDSWHPIKKFMDLD
jgi:hypothetical protein